MDRSQRRAAAWGLAALLAVLLLVGLWRRARVEAPQVRFDPPVRGLGGDADGPTLRGAARSDADPRDRAPAGAGVAVPEVPAAPHDPAPTHTLRVDFVHAFTGRDMEATWSLRPLNLQVPSAAEIAADPQEVRRRLDVGVAAWEATFCPGGSAAPFADVGAHGEVHTLLAAHPPAGFVLARPPLAVNTRLAAGVTTLVATIPVAPEAVLDVRVLGPDGRPAEGVCVLDLTLGGEATSYRVETPGPGLLRVRGLPHLAGEAVEAALLWRPAEDEGGTARPAALPPPGELDRELRTVVPESIAAPWSVEVTLPGPTDEIVDHIESDNDLPFEEHLEGPAPDPKAPRGRVRLLLLGWDGRPVVGALVDGVATDGEGRALLEGQPLGEREFELGVPGRLVIRGSTRVRADEEVEATLREDVGARLEIEVVDVEGRPLPAATVELRGNAGLHFDQDAATQRVDCFTDHRGRRSIARVAPGPGSVHARWGGRRGIESMTLVDGVTARVRVVAR